MEHGIRALNVAGARESKGPGIGAWAGEVLRGHYSRVEGVAEPGAEDSRRLNRWRKGGIENPTNDHGSGASLDG